jgi:integrase
MQKVLTDAYLRAVTPPATGRLEISDTRCGGLVLRVTSNGAKSWSFRFRDRTTQAPLRVTIGRYPDIGLAAAREVADGYRKAVSTGSNPAEVKRNSRGKSFGMLAERYLAEYARRKKSSHAVDERNLNNHVLPKWKNRAYTSIKRADVIELIEGLVTNGTPTAANRVQSLISGIFTFAIDAGLLDAHPSHRLRRRGKENVGTRVLADAEIKLFWHRIVDPPLTRRAGLALRLALLTAARVGEVAGINREELNDLNEPDRATWIISGARTKNKLDHLIPLSPSAREIVLELLSMLDSGDQYLLPTRTQRSKGHMRSNSLTDAMANFAERFTGTDDAVKTWRADPPSPHDLRRTVETRLASMRVPKEIRDRVLNHIAGDVGSKHYNRYDYADEKREVLNRWSLAVAAILDPVSAVVVPMVRGA